MTEVAEAYGFEGVVKLSEHRKRIDEAVEAERRAKTSAIVQTVGGTVEGAPTHAGNYLQRLRELVELETRVLTVCGELQVKVKGGGVVDLVGELGRRLKSTEDALGRAGTRAVVFTGDDD